MLTGHSNLQDYINSLVEKRIEKPGDDLISKLVVEQYRAGRLEKGEIVQLAFLVLVAGNAAMINSIGLVGVELLQLDLC